MSHVTTKSYSGVDKRHAVFFHHECSGVPIALVGLKGNPVRFANFGGEPNPELPPQLFAASPSRVATGLCEPKPGKAEQGLGPASQETCLNDVILPACGVRAWGGPPRR